MSNKEMADRVMKRTATITKHASAVLDKIRPQIIAIIDIAVAEQLGDEDSDLCADVREDVIAWLADDIG